MDFVRLLAGKGARELYLTLARFPRRQFTISELAKTAGVPFSTTWLLVRQWERAGMVDTGRVGRAVTVRFSGAEPARLALRLLHSGTSPQSLAVGWLRGRLAHERKVREAFLFGSVARGEERLESDIDVALLAGKGFKAELLAAEAEERFRAKLVPLPFSSRGEFKDFLKGKEAVRLK